MRKKSHVVAQLNTEEMFSEMDSEKKWWTIDLSIKFQLNKIQSECDPLCCVGIINH